MKCIEAFLRKIAVLFTLIIISFSIFSQVDIQQLEKDLVKSKGIEKVVILSDLSWEYSFTDPLKAIEFGNQAVKLAKSIKSESHLSEAYNSLGQAYFSNGNFTKSIECNKAALKIREESKDTLKCGSSLSKLGLAYQETTQYDKAIECHLKALEIFEMYKNLTYVGYTYNNLGSVYREIKQYDKALDCFKKAVLIAKDMGDKGGVAKALANTAIIYRANNQIDSAIWANEQALVIMEELDVKTDLATMYNNIGLMYRIQKNNQKGLEYYLKAYHISLQIQDSRGMATYLNNIGFLYADLGKLDSSLAYHKKTLELGKQIGSLSLEMKGYEGIASTMELMGDYRTALANYIEYSKLKDSVYNTESTKAIADMQTKYETEKQIQENKLQQKELEKNAAEISKKNTLIYASLIVLVIIILMTILIISRQKLKQKNLETELILKEERSVKEIQTKISEERIRISRDLHDNLGAELTLITSSADNISLTIRDNEIKQEVNEISDLSRNSVNILRDTIWAIRKDVIDLSEFESKLQQFIQQRKSTISFNIENKIEKTILLTPSQGLHLFRICQESIHNAIKHSNCDVMDISIWNNEGNVFIELKDNGKGMDDSKGNGYGLANMKERVSEINGTINISTDLGTTVLVSFPLVLV